MPILTGFNRNALAPASIIRRSFSQSPDMAITGRFGCVTLSDDGCDPDADCNGHTADDTAYDEHLQQTRPDDFEDDVVHDWNISRAEFNVCPLRYSMIVAFVVSLTSRTRPLMNIFIP